MNKFNMTIYDLAEEFSYSFKKDFDVLENSKNDDNVFPIIERINFFECISPKRRKWDKEKLEKSFLKDFQNPSKKIQEFFCLFSKNLCSKKINRDLSCYLNILGEINGFQ